MFMGVDIGNSEITIGLHDNEKWSVVWRMATVREQTELYYGVKLRESFFEARIGIDTVDRVVISSVVPEITEKVRSAVVAQLEIAPVVMGPDVYARLPLKILNPYQIGSDLVANALAAFTRYKRSCIVVDFGTALTCTIVSHTGEIEGVTIAPGLKTAVRSLSQQTSRLFDVPLEYPQSVLGKNTVHAIQAGILVGYEGMVLHLLDRIKRELNDANIPVVATGGLVAIIGTLRTTFDAVDPHLTLEGLRQVQ